MKFFAATTTALALLIADGTAAKRHKMNHRRQLQTTAPEQVTADEYINFEGPGCYNYDPNEAGWTTLPHQDDVKVHDVPLGFPFTFGQQTYDSAHIDENGRIFFGDQDMYMGGDFEEHPGHYIAAYTADAYTSQWGGVDRGSVKYKSIGNKFVVVWDEVSYETGFNSYGRNTFQIDITADGSGEPQVCFCYGKMEAIGYGRAAVGLSASGGNGFVFADFDQTGQAWNGIGSSGNGLGHLENHSYCFDTDIVYARQPQYHILATNDATIPPPVIEDPAPSPSRDEVTPPAPTNSGSGGDPHIITWKNEHFEYHGQCDLVLVKDPDFADGKGMEIHVRTKLVRHWSYIKNAAIKIGDDILEIEGSADADDAEAHYWFNYEYQGELEGGVAGFPVTQALPSVYKRRYIIDLSSKLPGASIIVELYKEFVRVRFNGNEQAFGKTVGLLGDYKSGKTLARDGITVLDDFTEFGDEWQVLPSEPRLFHEVSHPQFPELCIKPEDPRGERKRRLSESSISVEEAEAACASLKDPLSIKDCVYDILATQDLDMVGAF